jgi:hypothetical protein
MSLNKIKKFVDNLFEELPNNFKIKDNKYTFDNKLLSWIEIVKYGMNTDLDLLIKYGKFRKQVVDYLLNTIKKDVNCNDCSFRSVGSVTLTSDYDVSVFGSSKEEIVKRFNQIFVELFNNESGDIFDTNIYGVTALTPLIRKLKRNTTYNTINVCKDDDCKKYKYVQVPKGVTVDISNQRSWAFIKLFRYLDRDDIKKFQKQTNRMKINLLTADIYNSAERFKQLQKVGNFDNLSNMNNMYNTMLTKVKNSRKQMELYPNSLLHKITYKDAESHANFFSSESYYTQGAFFHVVARNQMKIDKLYVTDNELLDSLIENMGDFMKDIKHYSRTNCLEVVIKLSKYWMRFLDAAILIQKSKPDYKINGYTLETLTNAQNIAKDIRENIRGKKLVEDCKKDFDVCIEEKIAKKRIDELLEVLSIPKCELETIKQSTLDFLVAILKTHYEVVNREITSSGNDGNSDNKNYKKYIKYKTKYINLKNNFKV